MRQPVYYIVICAQEFSFFFFVCIMVLCDGPALATVDVRESDVAVSHRAVCQPNSRSFCGYVAQLLSRPGCTSVSTSDLNIKCCPVNRLRGLLPVPLVLRSCRC